MPASALVKPHRHWGRAMVVAVIVLLALALVFPQSFAVAQMSLEARVARLEQEMRAVQRKVFPGGNERFFEAEMAPTVGAAKDNAGSGSGLTPEVLARLDSLESSVTRLNARVEEQDLAMEAMAKRLDALETKPASPAATTSTPVTTSPQPVAAKPDPARVTAVAKIERTNTGNAFEDSYTYGYRLWEAKFFPEAQIALKETVDKFPNHPRASFARNLLGRAYLDDSKPGTSVDTFLNNYNVDPRGERAPDSLVYLAVALTRLNEKEKACVVLEEFMDVYPDSASGRLSRQYADAKAKAGCK
jgi:TolA-binding protein